MDQGWGCGTERGLSNVIPQPRKIVEVALDLCLGAAQTGRTHDKAHRLRQLQVRHDLLQPLAVAGRVDLAADPATVAAVRHEYGVAASKAQIGCQGSAFIAALFLYDLNEQYLSALDNVLNLVAAAQGLPPCTHFIHFLGAAFATALATASTAASAASTCVLLRLFIAVVRGIFIRCLGLRLIVSFILRGVVFFVVVIVIISAINLAIFDGVDLILFRRVDLFQTVLSDFFR